MNHFVKKSGVKITAKEKIGLVLLSIILTLIMIEIGLRIGGFIFLATQHFRNTIPAETKDIYYILALGESTTANLLNGQSSWPEELEIILNNRANGVKFKVFNEGIPGETTNTILSNLEDNLNKYNPNMVITMMGFNDGKLNMVYDQELKNDKFKEFLANLRVSKLAKWLWLSYKKKIGDYSYTIKEDNKCFIQSFEYIYSGKFKEAEEMLKKSIELKLDEYRAYLMLANLYSLMGKSKEEEEMYWKAIEINPRGSEKYVLLSWLIYMERPSEAEKLLKKAIEIQPNVQINNYELVAYDLLAYIYYSQGRLTEAEEACNGASNKISSSNKREKMNLLIFCGSKDLFPIDESKGKIIVFPKTTNNYRVLYQLLKRNKIKYISMQYPTLDINILKNMFKGNEDIIFISNEENFKKALNHSRRLIKISSIIRECCRKIKKRSNNHIAK